MVERVKKMHIFSGEVHSASIHTGREGHMEQLAIKANVGRVECNMPHWLVNTGSWFNGQIWVESPGCGSWADNLTRDHINWRHFLNYTDLSVPDEEYIPTDEVAFGDCLKQWRTP
jgi:sulfoacetaldehyde dehydrogenase